MIDVWVLFVDFGERHKKIRLLWIWELDGWNVLFLIGYL
jgi:hypothetical protein